MSVFLAVLVGIVLVLAGSAAFILPFIAWLEDWRTIRDRVIVSVAGLLAAAAIIAFGVSLIGGDDPAKHCAAGTRYTEQSRLVGKTVVTDWWCIPA